MWYMRLRCVRALPRKAISMAGIVLVRTASALAGDAVDTMSGAPRRTSSISTGVVSTASSSSSAG